MAIDKVLSSSIANGAVTAALISNTANLVVSSLTANVISITTISGSANVTGDMTVGGNLTISGTTTYVNTTDLNIGDAIISLNADLAANVSPTEDAGISINRGASTNAQFKWIESTDNWSIGNTTVSGVLTSNDHVITGSANVSVGINVGANVNLSTSLINVGNSTVNTVISATSLTTNTVTVNNTIDMNKAGNSAGIGFRRSNTYEGYITGISGGGLQFQTGSGLTSNVTIDSSGYMGIGTSAPASYFSGIAKLVVLNNTNAQYGALVRNDSAGSSAYAGFYVNASGNSWGMRMGSSAANSNALEFVVDAGGTPSPKMVLDTSGNLGIGTISPGDRLHAVAAVAAGLSLQASGTGGSTWRILSTDNAASLGGGYLGFNNGSYRMVLDSIGNMGLGTSTLTNSVGYATLSLSGSTGGQIAFQTSGTGKHYIYSSSTDLNFYNSVAGNLAFYTNSIERVRIDSSGNIGLGTAPTAQNSAYRAINMDVNNYYSIVGHNAAACEGNLLWNAYSTGNETFAYKTGGDAATRFRQSGDFSWYTANTGASTGAAVSFTRAMTLNNGGLLGIGITSPLDRLHVLMGTTPSNGDGITVQAIGDGGASSQPGVRFLNGSGTYLGGIYADNGTGFVGINAKPSSHIRFSIDNTEAARIGADYYLNVIRAVVGPQTFSSYQNFRPSFKPTTFAGSASVPTSYTWTTVFTMADIGATTGVNYATAEDSAMGFINIYQDFNNAYIIGQIAFCTKGYYGFSQLSVLTAYGYNASIQVSGTSIQVRQSGISPGGVWIQIMSFR